MHFAHYAYNENEPNYSVQAYEAKRHVRVITTYLSDILEEGHSGYLLLHDPIGLQLAPKLHTCGRMLHLRERRGGGGGGGGRGKTDKTCISQVGSAAA